MHYEPTDLLALKQQALCTFNSMDKDEPTFPALGLKRSTSHFKTECSETEHRASAVSSQETIEDNVLSYCFCHDCNLLMTPNDCECPDKHMKVNKGVMASDLPTFYAEQAQNKKFGAMTASGLDKSGAALGWLCQQCDLVNTMSSNYCKHCSSPRLMLSFGSSPSAKSTLFVKVFISKRSEFSVTSFFSSPSKIKPVISEPPVVLLPTKRSGASARLETAIAIHQQRMAKLCTACKKTPRTAESELCRLCMCKKCKVNPKIRKRTMCQTCMDVQVLTGSDDVQRVADQKCCTLF